MRKRKSNLKGMEKRIQMDLKPEPRSDLKSNLQEKKEIEL